MDFQAFLFPPAESDIDKYEELLDYVDGSLTNLDFLERECGSPMVKATPPRNDDDFDVDFRNAFEEVKKKIPLRPSIFVHKKNCMFSSVRCLASRGRGRARGESCRGRQQQ